MGRFKDLTGQQFGKLLVLEYLGNRKWKCECQCENKVIRIVGGYDLTSGNTTSCGCSRNKPNKGKDLTGQTFGRLTVIEYAGHSKYKCRCSCGSGKEIIVASSDLKSGHTSSCGCLSKEVRHKIVDETVGKIFGEWTVLEYVGNGYYRCRCSCKNERNVLGYSLRSGESKSCGHTESKESFIDLTDKQFGNWIAKKYVGKGYWECECQCKNKTIKNVASSSLTRGMSKSCGCISKNIRQETMLETYGDVVIGKSRDYWKIEVLHNEDKFKKFIHNTFENKGSLLNVTELAEILDINKPNVLRYIHKYGVESYVDLTNYKSMKEDAIFQLISKAAHNVERHNRTVLDGQELDIYIPSKNIAIEFNGRYWHSIYNKDKEYHKNKSIKCLRKNVRLIHIFEHEWDSDRRNLITKLLEGYLNCTDINSSIEIEDIEEEDNISIKEFIHKYKIYNNDITRDKLKCIFIENELCMIINYSSNNDNEIVIHDIIIKDYYIGTNIINKTLDNLKNKYNKITLYYNLSKPYIMYDNTFIIKEITEPECILDDEYYEMYDSGKLILEWKREDNKDGSNNTNNVQ